MLVGELVFGVRSLGDEHVKVGVLLGPLTAAVIATIILRIRNATYRRVRQA